MYPLLRASGFYRANPSILRLPPICKLRSLPPRGGPRWRTRFRGIPRNDILIRRAPLSGRFLMHAKGRDLAKFAAGGSCAAGTRLLIAIVLEMTSQYEPYACAVAGNRLARCHPKLCKSQ